VTINISSKSDRVFFQTIESRSRVSCSCVPGSTIGIACSRESDNEALHERLGMREGIEGKHAVSDQNLLNRRTVGLEFEMRTIV
jgi:hypothetical protein